MSLRHQKTKKEEREMNKFSWMRALGVAFMGMAIVAYVSGELKFKMIMDLAHDLIPHNHIE